MKPQGISAKLSAIAVSTLLMTSVAVTGSQAQELSETHLDAAKKAMVATNGSAKFNDILPAAVARLATRLISRRPDIEEQITDIVNESAIELAPRRRDLQNEAAKIYGRIFSEQELKDIAIFFSTDAGQKFLEQLPLIVREVDGASRIWGTGISRDLSTNVRKKMQDAGLE